MKQFGKDVVIIMFTAALMSLMISCEIKWVVLNAAANILMILGIMILGFNCFVSENDKNIFLAIGFYMMVVIMIFMITIYLSIKFHDSIKRDDKELDAIESNVVISKMEMTE
jgi:ABC-type multidrug transport system permease subunit